MEFFNVECEIMLGAYTQADCDKLELFADPQKTASCKASKQRISNFLKTKPAPIKL